MANLQRSTLASALAATVAIAACDEPATATGLHPEGPPMLQQVFMWEMAPDATNTLRPRAILAFGTHANVDDSFEVPNTQNGSADPMVLDTVNRDALKRDTIQRR